MKDAYLLPPKIITDPGKEYLDKTRQFQGIPGIAAALSGRLWAVWYGGGSGEDRHNYVLAASCSGGVWSGPSMVIDPDGPGPVRAYDPCVWTDPFGRLWLFWAQGYEGHTDPDAGVWCVVTGDPDSGSPRWSEPERICDGIMMNKPTVLSTGEWLLPAARWHQEGSARVYCSLDRGGKWVLLGQANVPEPYRNCDEHQIVERKDGTLLMLVRTAYGIGQSISRDRGRTWPDVSPSGIPHPASRFFIGRLDSGNLL
ncbi:MAG: sialidase family protein, partial [Spirochaetia bacterium]